MVMVMSTKPKKKKNCSKLEIISIHKTQIYTVKQSGAQFCSILRGKHLA